MRVPLGHYKAGETSPEEAAEHIAANLRAVRALSTIEPDVDEVDAADDDSEDEA